jgi:hypothetical protein
VFRIDIKTCHCGGALKVIASMKDPAVINHSLAHPVSRVALSPLKLAPSSQAPPERLILLN